MSVHFRSAPWALLLVLIMANQGPHVCFVIRGSYELWVVLDERNISQAYFFVHSVFPLFPGVQYSSNNNANVTPMMPPPAFLNSEIGARRYLPCVVPKEATFYLTVTCVDELGCIYGQYAGAHGKHFLFFTLFLT